MEQSTALSWSGLERREYTPVDLKHMGWGPRIALFGLLLTLVINILLTGMAYQRLVSTTTTNSQAIAEMRGVDVQLMRSINDMTSAMGSLTTSVEFLVEDIRELRRGEP